jgi:predicted metal-dependent hydrolase
MIETQISMPIDKLIRSRRRTIALIVTEDARLEVRAPLRASLEWIYKVIADKKKWIQKKQEQMRHNYFSAVPHEFVDGASFMYLGRMCQMNFAERADIVFHEHENTLHLPRHLLGSAQHVGRQHLVTWYQQQALKHIVERVNFYMLSTGLRCSAIRINNAKTRWGSCSAKGRLNFVWRLIMAPQSVIDYVVVHELVHIKIRNHAKRFWQHVEAILPDYKQQNAWLKKYGRSLKV